METGRRINKTRGEWEEGEIKQVGAGEKTKTLEQPERASAAVQLFRKVVPTLYVEFTAPCRGVHVYSPHPERGHG